MEKEQLKKMNVKDLNELAQKKREEIVKLKMEFNKDKIEGNVRSLRRAKKTLAQILTIINLKEPNEK